MVSDQTWQKKLLNLCLCFVVTSLLLGNEWSTYCMLQCMFTVMLWKHISCQICIFIVLQFLRFHLEDIIWCKNLACSLSLPQKKIFVIFFLGLVVWLKCEVFWMKPCKCSSEMGKKSLLDWLFLWLCTGLSVYLILGHVGVHLTFYSLFVNLNVMTLCDGLEITLEGTWALAKQKRTFFRVCCILIKSCMGRTYRATYLLQFFLSNPHIYISLV